MKFPIRDFLIFCAVMPIDDGSNSTQVQNQLLNIYKLLPAGVLNNGALGNFLKFIGNTCAGVFSWRDSVYNCNLKRHWQMFSWEFDIIFQKKIFLKSSFGRELLIFGDGKKNLPHGFWKIFSFLNCELLFGETFPKANFSILWPSKFKKKNNLKGAPRSY